LDQIAAAWPGHLRFGRKCYIGDMTTEDIEKAIEQLGPHELAQFRAWFEAYDARFKDGEYEPMPEELAGIDRGLRDAAEGRFASDDQVESAFAKFRGK
jgi:predicted transcriptional regulator